MDDTEITEDGNTLKNFITKQRNKVKITKKKQKDKQEKTETERSIHSFLSFLFVRSFSLLFLAFFLFSPSRGVQQARHVHRIASEALEPKAVVLQGRPIERVVMPHFRKAFLFEKLREGLQHLLADGAVSVHPEVGPRSEVDVVAGKDGKAHDGGSPDGTLLLQLCRFRLFFFG